MFSLGKRTWRGGPNKSSAMLRVFTKRMVINCSQYVLKVGQAVMGLICSKRDLGWILGNPV